MQISSQEQFSHPSHSLTTHGPSFDNSSRLIRPVVISHDCRNPPILNAKPLVFSSAGGFPGFFGGAQRCWRDTPLRRLSSITQLENLYSILLKRFQEMLPYENIEIRPLSLALLRNRYLYKYKLPSHCRTAQRGARIVFLYLPHLVVVLATPLLLLLVAFAGQHNTGTGTAAAPLASASSINGSVAELAF